MKHLLSIKIITLLLLLVSMLSYAEGVGPGLSVPALWGVNHQGMDGATKINKMYAYKKGTEQISWNFTKLNAATATTGTWTMRMYSPSGLLLAQQTMTNSTAISTTRIGTTTSTETGIFTVTIEINTDIQYSADINVKTNGTETGVNLPGRVYTYDVGVYSNTMPTFSLYSVNEQGYKYTSTFYGLYPVRIMFRINPFGNVIKNTCTSAYKSYTGGDPNAGVDPDPRYGQADNCGGASKIFFNSVAEDVPANAPRWDLTTNTQVTEWLNPGVAVENVTGLTFAPTEGSAGTFNFNVANYIGNATLKIDVNNNGVYSDAVDRSISAGVTTGSNSVVFDGKNGSGVAIPCGTAMKAQLVLDKPGEIHFVLWDAEGLNGIKITRTIGASAPSSVINWDDSNVYPAGKESFTPVMVGTNVNSSFNATTHGWPIHTRGWGDNAYIDNWAFLPGLTNQEIAFTSLCPAPDLTPIISLPNNNFAANGATKNFTVGLYELLSEPTEAGVIEFQVTVPTGFSINFNAALASITPTGGMPVAVKNADWTLVSSTLANRRLTFRAKAGISITALSNSVLGFTIGRVSAQPGSSSVITTNIINDLTLKNYDSVDANNIYSRVINAL